MPSSFSDYGESLVVLGTALQDENSKLGDLKELADAADLELTFRIIKQPDVLDRMVFYESTVPLAVFYGVKRAFRDIEIKDEDITFRFILERGRKWSQSLYGVGPARIKPLDSFFFTHSIPGWLES